jgi:hypothetical protein
MSIRTVRRRQRRIDPLASRAAIRSVVERVSKLLPDGEPQSEKDVIALLRAARHIDRYPASDSNRGRPPRFERPFLLRVGSQLRAILERETAGRISLSSFVDYYLRVLDFPADVVEPLERRDINLFEAEQLARLTPGRLGRTETAARRMRRDMLAAHLQAKLSGARLRQRVQELISSVKSPDDPNQPALIGPADLEDFDPHDPTHLFYDEIRRLGFALKEISPADLTDDLLDEYLKASEPLWSVLSKLEKRRQIVTRRRMRI